MAITIGSRGSQLALWQARHIAELLGKLGVETRIEIIKTTGDKIQDVPLARIGGKGLFTKEIEEALLDGSIDLAVHSMKDMPTAIPSGLTIAAIPEREDPRDALIGKTVDELKTGSLRVGTSSLRRSAQLRAVNADLEITMLRGNLDTRLRKLDEGQYDAIVLAAAGLRRLGWQDRITDLIPVEVMCPAVGQGALSIETRESGEAFEIAKKLDHRETNITVTAERALLATLEGGCQVPIGAHATYANGQIALRSIVASPDGTQVIRGELSGSDPWKTGTDLGERLLAQGARAILDEAYLGQAGSGQA